MNSALGEAQSALAKAEAVEQQCASPADPGVNLEALEAAQWAEELELMELLRILPAAVQQTLMTVTDSSAPLAELVEVVLDIGRPAIARYPTMEVEVSPEPITEEDLELAVSLAGEFGSDNRAGLDRTLHRISCIRSRSGKVVGLTCRVGRTINGCRALAKDLVEGGGSLLLMGRPGVGKTTAVREIARFLADECLRRVVIVDTSNEIGGDGDVPHPGVGRARRLQVPRPELQHEVMIEAVQNHMPEVIVIDEIGTEAEAEAARTIAQRGVQLVATAHGNVLENILKNPALSDLVGGIASVTLSDDEARRRGVQKTILERQGPPTFDCAVEMEAARRWRMHRSVATAVDSILLGRNPPIEIREMVDGTECITVRTFDAPAGAELGAPDRSLDGAAAPRAMGGGYGHPGGAASASDGAMGGYPGEFNGIRFYLHALDGARFSDVISFLDLSAEACIVDDLASADCVLALRTAIKGAKGEVLKTAGQRMGIPVFAIKHDTVPAMTRTLRAVLGMADGEDGVDGSPVDGGEPRQRTRSRADRKAARALEAQSREKGLLEEGTELEEALEEARELVERIVQPLGESVDLAPREESVLQAQEAMLAAEYGLQTERVDERLRVLPFGSRSKGGKKDKKKRAKDRSAGANAINGVKAGGPE